SNVEAEAVVAALVYTELLAVEPNFRFPIHGAEVQQRAIFPVLRNRKRTAIPDRAIHHLADAGERGFHRKRHQDFLRPRARLLRAGGEVPLAVEVLPFVTHHLGAWVVWVNSVRPDVLGPLGLQRAIGQERRSKYK